MKMRTWMAALVMGCAGMTVEAQTPTTDVDVATVLGHNLGTNSHATTKWWTS